MLKRYNPSSYEHQAIDMNRAKMKIIVTGGAGFIGSHIVDRYVSLGHDVIVIDDLSKGFKKNVNRKAKFYQVDIRDLSTIEKIFQKEKPDIVNHHAAIAEVVASLKNPWPTFEVNVLGTIHLLLAFGKKKNHERYKFIFASTGGAIYGDQKKLPVPETIPPVPISPYGHSKLLAEQCVKFYAHKFEFDFLIFRYGNVYGPRQNPKGEAGVIAIFADLMRRNERPTVFGDGTKTRDYVHVNDVARANAIGLEKGKNEILNLGSSQEVSDQEIYKAVARALDFKKTPQYKPFRAGEVYRIALDTEKAKRVLNWQSEIKLLDGIATVCSG